MTLSAIWAYLGTNLGGMAPKAGCFASDLPAKGPRPKSSRERRAAKKGK